MRGVVAFGIALVGMACRAVPAREDTPQGPSSTVAPAQAEAPDRFGGVIDPAVDEVELAAIEADPERFRDRTVRTRGTIVRVCQAMGCWLELASDGTSAVRVPMAGHAFFVPRDLAGRAAEVQGTVRLAELSVAMREHLEREGAQATGGSLAIEASAVRLIR